MTNCKVHDLREYEMEKLFMSGEVILNKDVCEDCTNRFIKSQTKYNEQYSKFITRRNHAKVIEELNYRNKCSKCNRLSEIIGQYKIKDRGFVNVELCRRHHEELIEELNNNQIPYQVIIESYIPQDVILN